jgi:hypothetical protein
VPAYHRSDRCIDPDVGERPKNLRIPRSPCFGTKAARCARSHKLLSGENQNYRIKDKLNGLNRITHVKIQKKQKIIVHYSSKNRLFWWAEKGVWYSIRLCCCFHIKEVVNFKHLVSKILLEQNYSHSLVFKKIIKSSELLKKSTHLSHFQISSPECNLQIWLEKYLVVKSFHDLPYYISVNPLKENCHLMVQAN